MAGDVMTRRHRCGCCPRLTANTGGICIICLKRHGPAGAADKAFLRAYPGADDLGERRGRVDVRCVGVGGGLFAPVAKLSYGIKQWPEYAVVGSIGTEQAAEAAMREG